MILKRHLSGCNIVVARAGKKSGKRENTLPPGRVQGSLYNYQKRLISDCCEAMRLFREHHEPVIFTLTSPGVLEAADEPRFLDRFLKALRKRGLENYVWVREYTGNGYPHFHFVAEIPLTFEYRGDRWCKMLGGRDIVDWSMLWSSYFGSDAPNSIRLGAGQKSGQTKYFLRSKYMAGYLSKYIGKGIGDNEKKLEAKKRAQPYTMVTKVRAISAFGTSCRSGARCKGSFQFIEPEIYEPDLSETIYSKTRKILRTWHCVESPKGYNDGTILSDNELRNLHWKQCGLHPVYLGYPKRQKKLPCIKTSKSKLKIPLRSSVENVNAKFLKVRIFSGSFPQSLARPAKPK